MIDTRAMPTPDEKAAFAARLQQALKRSPKRVDTAAELALQFNLRHPTGPITAQAAQKWMTGRALPTMDKMQTLAEWLGVPVAWLRLGVKDEHRKNSKPLDMQSKPLTAEEAKLVTGLRTMPEHRRNLVFQLVEQLKLDDELNRNAQD